MNTKMYLKTEDNFNKYWFYEIQYKSKQNSKTVVIYFFVEYTFSVQSNITKIQTRLPYLQLSLRKSLEFKIKKGGNFNGDRRSNDISFYLSLTTRLVAWKQFTSRVNQMMWTMKLIPINVIKPIHSMSRSEVGTIWDQLGFFSSNV